MNLTEQLEHLTQGELSLLTFECLTTLTSSHAKWRELQEQGKMTKLFRNLKGKNNALRMAMYENIITAQNAAVKILNQVVNQQGVSFSIISSLHEKVTHLQYENDQNFKALYQTIEMIYEDSTEKFQQLNFRITQLEKKVSLMDWRQSVPYLTYQNIPYVQLRTEEKIVCTVNDFYHATQGNWQQADEKYLDYMLLDLKLNESLSLNDLYKCLLKNQHLFNRLLAGIQLERPIDRSIYGKEPLVSIFSGKSPYFKEEQADIKRPAIELAMHLLTQLALVDLVSRAPIGFELVLASIPHVDERLRIHRTLHLDGGISLEQCPNITNNTPATVNVFNTLKEAKPLKKALEQHKCQVLIMEVF